MLNAWRDSDGHHCLTCLAHERDEARESAAARAESASPRSGHAHELEAIIMTEIASIEKSIASVKAQLSEATRQEKAHGN